MVEKFVGCEFTAPKRRQGERPVKQEELAAQHDRRRLIDCYELVSVSDQKQTSLTVGMSCWRVAASDGSIDRPRPSPERFLTQRRRDAECAERFVVLGVEGLRVGGLVG